MAEIKWLRSAQNDLNEIFDFISTDSKRYAARQIEKIYSSTQQLIQQPLSGKLVSEINDSTIREIREGNYRIIYRVVSADLVHILLVHHSSRDLTRRL